MTDDAHDQDHKYTIGRDVDLKAEQEKTLSGPEMKPGFILGLLVFGYDLVYGKARTLPKFKVLEILARPPYWAWEDGGYRALTRRYARTGLPEEEGTRRSLDLVDLGRESQDNEQWHLFLIEEVIARKGIKLGWFRHWLLPRILSWKYYYFTRLLFLINPAWSFRLNAEFESHAEHQYMLMSREHPEWDEEEIDLAFFDHYPRQKTLGDLVRRIGLDERDHKHHSLEAIEQLKF